MILSEVLNELIDAAISDGNVTEKERDTLYRRALREGVDIEVVDLEISKRLGLISIPSEPVEEQRVYEDRPVPKEKVVFDESVSGTRVYYKGLFIKDVLRFNNEMVDYEHRYLQWPLAMFQWVGFIGHQQHTFAIDSDLTYYMNTGKFIGRKTLYLSQTGCYDSLPKTADMLANDDADDLTFQNLGDRSYTDGSPLSSEEFNSEEHLDDDLRIMTETIQLRFKKRIIEELFGILEKSNAVAPHIVKSGHGLLNQKILVYQNEWAFHVMPHCFSDSEIDSTPIRYMAFFLSQPGLRTTDIYCGYHRQIDVRAIPNKEAESFHSWCKARAPRLTEKGKMYKSSRWANPFNIWRWLHPDKLAITAEALIYTRKTSGRDEMIYLPFSRSKMFLSSKGLFAKYFEIYGEQNIIPKYSFSSSDVSDITNAIKHKIQIKEGKSYSSSIVFMRNWFGRAPRILVFDDRIVFYPNRIENMMKEFNGDVSRVSSLSLEEIHSVTWYKPTFDVYGTLEIDGVNVSIRKDQSNKHIKILIPDLSMFCYSYFFFFTGSLKLFLERSNARFDRERKHHYLFDKKNRE